MASFDAYGAALARIAPSEVLVARWPDASDSLAVAVRGCGARFSDLPRPELTSDEADGILATAYGGGWREALRGFSPPEIATLAALCSATRRMAGRVASSRNAPERVGHCLTRMLPSRHHFVNRHPTGIA